MATKRPRCELQEGWFFGNPDTGTEWSLNHPIESGECDDPTWIEPATLGNMLRHLLEAWNALREARREFSQQSLNDAARDAAP